MKATSLAFVLAALLVNVTWRQATAQTNDGWSGGGYSPTTTGDNRQFDQRGPTIGVQPIRTAETDPWTIEGAQQAATDAGNSLRDSVNSGAQQLNQQGQQAIESMQNAGRDFGQQLQNMTGFNGQPSPPAATSGSATSATRWSAPPPLTSSPATTAAPPANVNQDGPITPQSWSSIRPELAPPRLATPRLASNPSTSAATRSSGPSFPAPPLATDTTHSVLAPPASPSTAAQDQDWSSIWGTPANTNNAASNDDGSGLLPVPPRSRAASIGVPSSPASTASSLPAPPVDDRYRAQSPVVQPPSQGVDQWANAGQRSAANFDPRPTPQQQIPAAPPSQPLPQIGQATIGTQPIAGQPMVQAPPAEEVPWKPLLGVSLALAGSVGANFFLGMSYADSRRRYRSLVAKTTYAFQKEAGVAA